jgi:hypothetical protein
MRAGNSRRLTVLLQDERIASTVERSGYAAEEESGR